MPIGADGNYRMNAQIARSPIGGKKASSSPAAPADPSGDSGDQVKTITISFDPSQGTFHTSEPDGQEADFPDFASAMQKAGECLGASPEPDADDQGADASGGAAPSGNASQLQGM
jgi:hypothetical protein